MNTKPLFRVYVANNYGHKDLVSCRAMSHQCAWNYFWALHKFGYVAWVEPA